MLQKIVINDNIFGDKYQLLSTIPQAASIKWGIVMHCSTVIAKLHDAPFSCGNEFNRIKSSGR